ncbi:UDP-glucose 4-epimerase GalE [Blastococcus litoris]|uniref:UDP-glucose 4-epimerase GalE n=1 Tax=Blastococcus litoris TaxID=2171622 RepID=UPI000E300AB1|nr:UDP-glucose 4-epimerase GalE [Blastococcus litoris]
MTWLVTGGAGYIGSHVVGAMQAAGHEVVVLDDLSSGVEARLAGVPLVVGSVLDQAGVERALRDHSVRGVVHLAGKKQVEESVRRPLHYYEQNVEGLRRLLDAITAAGVEHFVFSSSAAVYGAPDEEQVTEELFCRPVNPYGETKLIGEWMVAAVARATGLRYANLRYFNVAGAAVPTLADTGESNLVPMVFRRLSDRRPPLIFGDTYPTPDGTCVRDFVHVADIASAHVSAAQALTAGRVRDLTANIGTGQGVSVRDVVETIRSVTGTADESWSEPVVVGARAGDPPRVVASAERIRAELGWKAQHDVRDMVASAWEGWVAHSGR